MSALFLKQLQPAYIYIETTEEYKEFWAGEWGTYFESKRVWANDTETDGLNPASNSLRTIQIAVDSDTAVIFDFQRIDQEVLVPDLSDRFTRHVKVAHNAVFEAKWYEHHGIPYRGYPEKKLLLFDTMLADQLYSKGHIAYRYSFAACCRRYLNLYIPKDEQIGFHAKHDLYPRQLQYAATDVCALFLLYRYLSRKLAEPDPLNPNNNLVEVASLEFQVIPVIAEMELHGIAIDWGYLRDNLIPELQSKLEVAQKEFQTNLKTLPLSLWGDPILPNMRSSQQVLALLKEETGLPLPSTDKDDLSLVLEDETGTLDRYLATTKFARSADTAVDFEKSKNPATGRVHTSFQQCFTETGRFSARAPNLQNIPRSSFRNIFIASPGYSLVVADYSQIELRIAAEIAPEPTMQRAYLDGVDAHKLMASVLSGVELRDVTKEQRSAAKAINFGFLYGMGWRKFKRYAFTTYGLSLTDQQAKEARSAFFDAWPAFASWHNRFPSIPYMSPEERAEVGEEYYNSQLAKLDAYSYTRSGRRRFLPLNKRRLTMYANNPVQGLGADIMKTALVYVFGATRGTGARMLLQIHDEILLEAPTSIVSEIKTLLSEQMERAGRVYLKTIPVLAEAGVGQTWAEAKKDAG